MRSVEKGALLTLFSVLIVVLSAISCSLIFVNNKTIIMNEVANLYYEGISDKQEVGKATSDIKYGMKVAHVINYPTLGSSNIDNKILNEIESLKNNYEKKYEGNVFSGLDSITYYQYIDYETYLAPSNLMSVVFYETNDVNNESVINKEIYTYNFDINTGELLKDSFMFIGNYKEIITEYLKDYLNNEYKESLNDNYNDVINKDTNYRYALTNKGVNIYFKNGEVCDKSKGDLIINIPYSKIESIINFDFNNETKKLEPNTGINSNKVYYSDVSKKMYTKSLINFYLSDNRNSELIGNINKGEIVLTIAESNTGWTKIKYNDEEGYVTSSYLSEDIVIVDGMKECDEIVYILENAKVYKSDNTESSSIGRLSKNKSIKRVGVSDSGWSEIIFNKEIGFVESSYLSTKKPTTKIKTTTTKRNTTEITTENVLNNNEEISIKIDVQRNIDPSKPMVALTFDDGPSKNSTSRILDTLEKYNTVATFFDLGNLINSYPNIVRREEAIGCEVGTHSYNHPNLNKLSTSELNSQMSRSNDAFMKVLGHKPTIMRAPYGNSNSKVRSTIKMPFIHWTIDTLDWKNRNKNSILSEIRKTSNYDGKIILMHSIYGSTADAVEILVPELISKGYQLVTISEMAYYKGKSLTSGNIYYSF